MKRVLACGAMVLSLTGCFRMSVRSGAPRSGEAVSRGGVSLAYGLTTSNVAAGQCRHGLSRVDVYWPAWGPLVYLFSFGIVAPLRAEYVCAEGPDAPAGPSDAEAGGEDAGDVTVPPSHPPL